MDNRDSAEKRIYPQITQIGADEEEDKTIQTNVEELVI